MMARNMDLLIFGATGFTGKHAIPIIHKLSKANGRNLSWGVAGRSEAKLKEVLKECEAEVGESLDKVPVVIADVKNEDSLKAMASKTRVVINCCGPYRFFGEPVVKACVEQGTHHVDVSGEPQYMEAMQLKYHEQAREKGIYIISACGFDSIPSDLGVVFLQQKFGGTVNSVVTYLDGGQEGEEVCGPSINYGTWESAIYGLAHANELPVLRRQLYPTRLPKFEPKLELKSIPHHSDVVPGWVVPFLGSDRSVVRRSQRYFYDTDHKRPVQIETYFIVKSFLSLMMMSIFGLLFKILCSFEYGRSILLKYPSFFSGGFFSKEPPSEDKIKKSWFSITFYGEGWKESLAGPDDKYSSPVEKSMTVKVSGKNPGYGATCVSLVLSGILVITEANKMPPGGGVYPPAAAFAKTTMIQQLCDNGVKFEVLAEKDLFGAKI